MDGFLTVDERERDTTSAEKRINQEVLLLVQFSVVLRSFCLLMGSGDSEGSTDRSLG